MNFPVWDLPGRGLLIAFIAILHVFISHFAVGGGLFLVLTERRARRTGDTALLAWVRAHSRFFVLLTLVLGAITGVGIWFTIGLVHPDATAVFITTFVWVWAIEWTFFLAEIAAALVYYYGWDRLSPRAHLRVGWIYFWNAWLSLVVINGILSFMLTPGDWVRTGEIADAFFNPTYWPSLVVRTLGAMALAGIYALLTVSWHRDGGFRARVVRYAGLQWVLPATCGMAIGLAWWVAAARDAGVPLASLFGAQGADLGALLSTLIVAPATGYPPIRAAALVFLAAVVLAIALVAWLAAQPRWLTPVTASLLMAGGLAAIGGAEWVRESMRKPWVLPGTMFSNGVTVPLRSAMPVAFAHRGQFYDAESLQAGGLLATARFTGAPQAAAAEDVEAVAREGELVFRALCTTCHTLDGYLAVRPLVSGQTPEALEGLLARLATPVNAAGHATTWRDPDLRLITWRDRGMPPFAGDARDRRALAVYLASVGGAARDTLVPRVGTGAGAEIFEANCGMCHGADGAWPLAALPARSAVEYYELLGRLPAVNEMMPPYEGTDAERRALADHLAVLPRQ